MHAVTPHRWDGARGDGRDEGLCTVSRTRGAGVALGEGYEAKAFAEPSGVPHHDAVHHRAEAGESVPQVVPSGVRVKATDKKLCLPLTGAQQQAQCSLFCDEQPSANIMSARKLSFKASAFPVSGIPRSAFS